MYYIRCFTERNVIIIFLNQLFQDLHQAFQKVDRLQGKRIFGTYYRVAFYGSRFGDLDGEEYIYKEKPLAKLVEIAHRIEVIV